MYPDVRFQMRKLTIFSRIYLFAAIVLEAVLFSINLAQDSQIWWSAITGLFLLYLYMVLRYAILGKTGYRSKVLVLSMIAVLSAIAIDLITGFQGWSLDYVLPIGILVVDAIIVGCMFFNRRNWQSYIMWQILMILLSLIPIILYLSGLEHKIYIVLLPMAVSAAIFLGTMIIGDRRARMELKRRFHIR